MACIPKFREICDSHTYVGSLGGYLNLKTLVANFDMYYIIFLLHVDVNNVYLYKLKKNVLRRSEEIR